MYKLTIYFYNGRLEDYVASRIECLNGPLNEYREHPCVKDLALGLWEDDNEQ